ncbi:hypothetical protein [Cellulomonas sp. PhB150]|uniref:hypothetical protein n=1 Tax=Cellulomonas sp. PhB150 TaxID=2485188 RepID=UPI000F4AF29A|nr:hypothetical protein [Cellulomonas sp. PhB150]
MELTAEQVALVDRIARSYASAVPAGWLRIVVRHECSVAEGPSGIATVQVVIVETSAGLEQRDFDAPDDVYWDESDLLKDLATASPTKAIAFVLVVERSGTHDVTVTQDGAALLAGERDQDPTREVLDHLERHREELTALLG